ncbi:MAG TPA: tetratricopeptide repeat protein [Vicinamibacteria bacterium]|nr:tetratricopeptide repeat protein [Vicinamibacteria bacterium]
MLRPLLLVLVLQPGPASPPPLPDMLEHARQLLELPDRPAARRELEEALRLYPESPAVHNFLGVLEAGEGNTAAAERHFRDALSRAPDYSDAWLNLGRLYQENAGSDPQASAKALAAYQAVLRTVPGHAEARFQEAALLQASGRYERSLQALGRLSAADQARPAALVVRLADFVGLGDRAASDAAAEGLLATGGFDELDVRAALPVLAAHGREDLAVRLLEDLRRRGHVSTNDLQQLALLMEGQGKLVEARVRLEEAARSRPDDVRLLLDLARVAHKAGDGRGALGYLAHARALEPKNARVHFLFGMVCVDLDLGAEAYNSMKEAVRLDPESPEINYAMGAIALHRKDPGEAIPYFRKYAELRPKEPRGPFAVGIAAFFAKDYDTARKLLVPAAQRPQTAAAASYYLARMARAENDFDEALRLARQATQANPRYADAWAELGLVHLRLGQPRESEEALRRCLELDPESYFGNLHLAMLYAQTRDPREEAQRQRFDEIKKKRAELAADFLRPIEVRPY